jgi:FixJ family two-component response regulator
MTPAPLICIVDDDASIREATSSLVRSAGYRAVVFESAEAFLNDERKHEFACLVLDIQMPGINGLELQRLLAEMGASIPIIIVSADSDELSARALAQGAVAILQKPFRDDALLSAIHSVSRITMTLTKCCALLHRKLKL